MYYREAFKKKFNFCVMQVCFISSTHSLQSAIEQLLSYGPAPNCHNGQQKGDLELNYTDEGVEK